VLLKSDYDQEDDATVLLELLPDKPCLIVPSCLSAGMQSRFELRCGQKSGAACLVSVAGVTAIETLIKQFPYAEC
jgi:hypothetical protein